MSSTFLSIFTMFNYYPTIFDDLVIPAQMDKELLIDNILLELSEFEVLYNDPDFLKFAIGRWSSKELSNWEKLYNTTILTYNPIENYNRTENTTDLETRDLNGSNNQIRSGLASNQETRNLNGSNNETRDLDGSNIETRNLASTGTENNTTASTDIGSGSDTNVKSVTGFNGPDLVTKEQDVTTLGTTKATDTTSESTFGGTDTGTKSIATEDNGTVQTLTTDAGTINNAMTDSGTVDVITTDKGEIDTTRTSNAFGNIGVTTTQQMIEQERKVLEFKIYDYIIKSFKLRFCITVY